MKYDIEAIEKKHRRLFFCYVFLRIFAILLFVSSTVSLILSSSNTLLFIISSVCLIISLATLFYVKKKAKATSVKTYSGKIEKTELNIGASNGIITVGYGGLVRKRYSQYYRDINRLTLYIRAGEDLRLTEIADVPRELEDYYRSADEVVHIGGTRFPVNPKFTTRWLCPICGQFSLRESSACQFCKNKIIRD